MFLLFDEAGKFLAGKVLSEAESSLQVELDSGKRVKVKAANALLKFEKPAPAAFVSAAQALSQTIELELAWEFSPDEEFGFADLARDYFSSNSKEASLEQQAAALYRLHESPHYFRRAGKGRFRKAGADVIALALAAIEKKKQVALQITQWVADLGAGACPDPIREQLYKILFKPDKNAPEYKAVVEASRATHLAPLDLLQKAGAIDSPYQFHWRRFLLENFPKGTGFPAVEAPLIRDDLALAPVQAFSIDDSATTEIDDALSVQGLGSGEVIVGVGLGPQPVTMEEWRAVTLAQRHRRALQPRNALGAIGVAVERRVGAGLRQRRHHIGRRAERPAPQAQHAAGKAGFRKTTTCGLQQRQTSFQRKRKRAAARLDPLDALGRSRPGLLDAAHRLGAHGFCDQLEQPACFEFVANQPLRDLAIAGFRQRLPEEEALRHLVARHFRQQERGQFRFAHGSHTFTHDADGDADFAPERVGHTQHRDFADRGMGQNLLLDLARIDVRSARNVHVRGAPGDVDRKSVV